MNPLFSFLADKILNYVSTSENLNFAGRCDRAAAGVPTGGRRNSLPRTWSKYFVLVISRGFEIMSSFRTVDSMSKYHTQTSLKNLWYHFMTLFALISYKSPKCELKLRLGEFLIHFNDECILPTKISVVDGKMDLTMVASSSIAFIIGLHFDKH